MFVYDLSHKLAFSLGLCLSVMVDSTGQGNTLPFNQGLVGMGFGTTG